MLTKWTKPEVIRLVICYVLFIVLLLASQLPGFLSPLYWAVFPAVSAFMIAGPLTCVMNMKPGFGSSALLIVLWVVTYKCIGELGMTAMWVWPLVIAILVEIVRAVLGYESKTSLRVSVMIAALAPFGHIFPLYFQKTVFLEAAMAEMEEEYVAGLDKYGTLPMCILVLALSLVLAAVSERISEKILKVE